MTCDCPKKKAFIVTMARLNSKEKDLEEELEVRHMEALHLLNSLEGRVPFNRLMYIDVMVCDISCDNCCGC